MTTSAAELHDLRDTVRRALGGGPSGGGPPSLDPAWRDSWPELAGLGVLALCVPEDLGGLGWEIEAAFVVGHELGAALHGAPYAGAAAATAALAPGLSDSQRAEVVGAVLDGSELPTVALLEPGGVISSSVSSGASDTSVRVDGMARAVAGAGHADAFLVIGADAMAYVRRTGRCALVNENSFDVTRSCADVRFDGASGLAVASDPTRRATTLSLHGLLLAADALGGVERTLAQTIDYARTRQAFGRPIGGFQAVQHRIVDHTVTVRGMVLLARKAGDQLTSGDPGAGRTALLAQAAIATDAVAILHDLLQLTGAIGFTWEYGLHLYERRAHLDARLAGNPRHARHALALLEGWCA